MVRGSCTVLSGPLCALALAAVTPLPANASPLVFLDPAAWAAAIGSRPMQPGLTIANARLRDGHGSYTDPAETVLLTDDGPSGPEIVEAPRLALINGWGHGRSPDPSAQAPLTLAGGDLFVAFGCHPAHSPCIGLTEIEFAFLEPVLGVVGDLEYHVGYDDDCCTSEAPIPLFAEPWRLRTLDAASGLRGYAGFFGILFDEPVTMLRITWAEGIGRDDSSWFHLRNVVVIPAGDGHPVPEPASLAVLAAALAGLAAVTRPRPALHRARP